MRRFSAALKWVRVTLGRNAEKGSFSRLPLTPRGHSFFSPSQGIHPQGHVAGGAGDHVRMGRVAQAGSLDERRLAAFQLLERDFAVWTDRDRLTLGPRLV